MTNPARLAADQREYQYAVERRRLDPGAPDAEEDVTRAYKQLFEAWAENGLREPA